MIERNAGRRASLLLVLALGCATFGSGDATVAAGQMQSGSCDPIRGAPDADLYCIELLSVKGQVGIR